MEWLFLTGGILLGGITVWAVMGHRRRTMRNELLIARRDAHQRADQVSVVSHEIRTPLAAVKAASRVLSEETAGSLSDTQKRFVGIIVHQSDLAISIAEDLLLQARLESGLVKVEPIPVEVGRIVRETVNAMRPLVQERQQRLVCSIPRLDPQAYVDERLVRQALTNMLSNAIKHTSSGEEIVVTLRSDDEYLVLSVTDGGAGMTPEERAKLFSRFFSSGHDEEEAGSSSISGFGASVGLGMTITRQIAELHGGKLLVDTAQKRGTTVMMTIPRQTISQSRSRWESATGFFRRK
ncbi:MAG: HAMP domain-containing sensor histidine kinase [Scrofimicrobium sp.]